MTIPIDIHTHHLPQVPGEAIVNCYPDAFAPKEREWYSVGIHPWHITSSHSVGNYSATLSNIANHPQILAIGEAGLDKMIDAPISLQIEFFEYQARLAMQVDKPLIIHLVKSVDELLRLKQLLKPTNPWIIHGFRGKADLAKVYLRHDFYLSFGEKYQEDALLVTPAERLLLESDESVIPIHTLYQHASITRGVSLDKLTETVRLNIDKLFFKR